MKDKFDGLVDQLLNGNVPLADAVEILERSLIQRAVALTEGNQSAAAKQLGIHRNTLQRKMAGYGLANGRPRARRKPPATEARSRKRNRTA